MRRRECIAALAGLLALPARSSRAADFAPVLSPRPIRFPDDEGAHPEFRTEWWYITGWLNEAATPLGFQITFFRTRPHPDTGNPSRFDPRELIIAHAAVSEPALGRLRHAQRVARAGFGLAGAATGHLDVKLDDWRLSTEDGRHRAAIASRDLALDLRFERTQPPLLQGERGYSRKGPRPQAASYYYSHPHLAVAGSVHLDKRRLPVSGTAWFDHEWSSEYLDPEAAGWDWIGINLADGGALMVFRMRTHDDKQHWAGATLRTATGAQRAFGPEDIRWTPIRRWRSPRTGAHYPIETRVHVGDAHFDIVPLFDDQENDTRLTTGAVYWEGAVTASREGHRLGRGYLELTGYAGRLRV